MSSPIGSILLVDDSDAWRAQLRKLLLACRGLQVVGEACDGREAVSRAAELNPDLVLLAIGIPVLNGFDATHQIRQVSPRSKVVFVTQQNDVDLRSAALAAGASGYVLKMNAATELLPTIAAALSNHKGNG